MNIANKLTLLRVAMIPLFLVFLLMDITEFDRLIAISIFVLASCTDWLDGYLARKMNLITNFGKFMDPVADKLLVCSALIALVELGLLPSWVVIIIISRDFILMTFRMIASDANIVIAADKIGKIKTMMQMVMIIYLMIDFNAPELFGQVLVGAVIALTIVSASSYILKNVQLLR